MRLLPQSLVIHRWVPEAVKLKLTPIGMSTDGRKVHLARPETVDAFNKMIAAAKGQNVHMIVLWAYRSPHLQKEQFEEAQQKHGKRQGIRWLAPSGFSEHQTGWALDIGDENDPAADDNPLFERTAVFRWLSHNAIRYGFELSFKPGNWQGVQYEPWHWRYVGNVEARDAFHPKYLSAIFSYTLTWVEALKWWLHP